MSYGEYIPWNHGTVTDISGEEAGQAWLYVTRKAIEARLAGERDDEALYRFESARFSAALGGRGLTALQSNEVPVE